MNQKEILMSDLYSRLNAHMPNPLPSTLSLSTQLRATSPVDQTTINDDELNAYIRYAAAWMSKWKTKKNKSKHGGFVHYLRYVWQIREPDLACDTIITQSQFDSYFS